jgi:hypothetical protein
MPQVVIHELPYLGALGAGAVDVDEQDPRQRPVDAAPHVLRRRRDGALADAVVEIVDGDALELVPCAVEVAVAHVAEGELVVRDASDDDRIVAGRHVVLAAGAGAAVHGGREVVERARFRAGTEERNPPIGPAFPYLAPPGDRALRLGRPEGAELRHRHRRRPRVPGVHDDGNGVARHRQLHEVHLVPGTRVLFLRGDRT